MNGHTEDSLVAKWISLTFIGFFLSCVCCYAIDQWKTVRFAEIVTTQPVEQTNGK